MSKKIFLILLMTYLILSHYLNIYIFCPIKKLTGFFCPGCGLTRMLYSLITLNFYQAFRYNPLLFIMFPFALALYINYLKNPKTSWYKKIPNYVWYIIIVVLIVYGIMRNIPMFSFLAPTKV
jgi:hypothetical protein